ncbi:hypothetical protein OG883_43030 [Streptomyces sp. NBC_01142]|uniref:hypothetical protein n=1 Tax=Streptomyces sp. NBC_01142 TaxID=2975865 RepID=UPI00225BF9CD|nr:hypothetical protein [Streptomyces sp. NBC_01142]MCX4826416.1 hypothetical protein [Streptomyces sp. NBC_01142]
MEWVRRRRRLNVAAGIARIELVCAPSVWSAMLIRCARRYGTVHFAEGMQQPAGTGLVRVALSGLELSELMDWRLEKAVGEAGVSSRPSAVPHRLPGRSRHRR